MSATLSNNTPARKGQWMDHALELARRAGEIGEVPVGAVIIGPGQEILGAAHNETLTGSDPTAHAEILAIRQACANLKSQRLVDCDLYVTLEPCAMCAAAISFARIRRLYFAASDAKGGAVEHGIRLFSSPSCHHKPDVYSGIGEQQASILLKDFFSMRR